MTRVSQDGLNSVVDLLTYNRFSYRLPHHAEPGGADSEFLSSLQVQSWRIAETRTIFWVPSGLSMPLLVIKLARQLCPRIGTCHSG